MAHILNGADPQSIQRAAALLQTGGVVAFPTETVYGLGADALNEHAVAQVFAIKQRPTFDPLIVHIADPQVVSQYASRIDDRAIALMERFWPGPLTLVLPKTADYSRPGHRRHANRCLTHARSPHCTCPTPRRRAANRRPKCQSIWLCQPNNSPACTGDTWQRRLRSFLMAVRAAIGLESTVCALTDEEAVLLRPGGVSLEALEAVIGSVSPSRFFGF